MAVAYTWRKTVASARQLTPKRVKICLPAAAAESVAYLRSGPNRRAANVLGRCVMSNRSSLLPCLRLLCIAAAGFFATGQAAMAEPQEIKVVEHADTDAVTDTGDKGDTA